MPGILPMKVIKVGNSSQPRIAQACDRCRSKKIKCDGIRPCCSQCANVGFECKTSDKLSRRAFPRGYTESLEERVRSLEAEVRELKDLLDSKEEKIELLSKMHENRRPSQASLSPMSTAESRREPSPPKEDVFKVQASPLLLESDDSDSYFMGASSGRAFVGAFKRKIQESGKSCAGFNTEAFLNVQRISSNDSAADVSATECIPPRLFSDKCVQIFWQEWAPLFPILNKSTFLRLYEEYSADPEKMTDDHKLAQLHLVFGIAALSSSFPDEEQISMCEHQWRTSLSAILMDSTLLTLQCLILATIYCLQKGDYKRLQQYKGIAVALSYRLGLHQSQKRFSFGALTLETRKKVFWSLYTVDLFSAATLGLPALLREEDVQCELPADIDDEYITEKGFLPTLPGESSKVSSALALFRASRILSKVLQQNYPATTSHDLSLQSLSALEGELSDWSNDLPTHLKLNFVQDKPSTDVTGDRSAILALAYYYIRTLIHRPAVGSSLGDKASSCVMALADSSKHIVQIVQLLEERSMSFSFCLNKNELTTLCALSLLYQGLDLKQEGKLIKDSQRLVSWVVKHLEDAKAPGALDFRRLAASMTSCDSSPNMSRRATEASVPVTSQRAGNSPNVQKSPARHSVYAGLTSASDTNLVKPDAATRRPTFSGQSYRQANLSRSSLDSYSFDSPTSQQPTASSPAQRRGFPSPTETRPNLDYLPLDSTDSPPQPEYRAHPHSSSPRKKTSTHSTTHYPGSNKPVPAAAKPLTSTVTPAEWESLLSSLDSGDSNIYDAVYGGPSISLTSTIPNPPSYHLVHSASNHTNTHNNLNNLQDLSLQDNLGLTTTISNSSTNSFGDWSPEAWDMATLNMNDFDLHNLPPTAQSVLSFSEESLSSGDDLDGLGFNSGASNGNCSGRNSLDGMYGSGVLVPGETYILDNLEVNFGI